MIEQTQRIFRPTDGPGLIILVSGQNAKKRSEPPTGQRFDNQDSPMPLSSAAPPSFFRLPALLALTAALALGGCATVTPPKNDFAAARQASNFQAIAANFLDAKGQPAYDRNDLQQSLEAAKAFHDAGLWAFSNEAFSVAHGKLAWKENTVDTPAEVLNLIGTTLTSSAFGTYPGKIHEGSLLNFYRALNMMMLAGAAPNPEHRRELEQRARVEFNRLEERQQNALTQLQAFGQTSRQSRQQSLGNDKAQGSARSYQAVGPKVKEGFAEVPAQMRRADIRNASGDLLAAAFRSSSSFAQDKDPQRIGSMIAAAAGSAPGPESNAMIADFQRSVSAGSGAVANKIFVVYEDGNGPSLSEFRLDLPMYLVSNNILYSGIALPRFNRGQPALGSLRVGGEPTVVMTDLNRIVGLEFRVGYDAVVAQAVVSTVIKTAAQYAANKRIDQEAKSPMAALLMKAATGAIQAGLTRADTRYWRNLPNTIQIAVLDRPADGLLTIATPGGRTFRTLRLESGNHLLLIKASGTAGPPAIHVARLG
jgi:hypothetical protein